jgi:hypothetical protein
MTVLQQPTAAGHAFSFHETTYEFTPVPEPMSLMNRGCRPDAAVAETSAEQRTCLVAA